MLGNDPTGWPALIALAIGMALFVAAMVAAKRRSARDATERRAARSRRSMAGVAIQMAAFVVATLNLGPVVLRPLSPTTLAQAAVVLALWVAAVALFAAATRAMGRNWSIAARTRDDHQLVRSGPFAYVRHPIYTAIALELIGAAVAFGHGRRLLIALPVYAVGTWLRIREEERLLRTKFGTAYDDYAGRVRRFVPGVF